jgi:hypothetical protein
MMSQRRNSQVAERFAERRRREDEAPRLRDRVPGLKRLQLLIEERTPLGGTKHVRSFLVDRAPALFLVRCGDPRCADGEHDLTDTVMRALAARQTEFHGSDECIGSVGTSGCSRVLSFDGTAEYGPGDLPRKPFTASWPPSSP